MKSRLLSAGCLIVLIGLIATIAQAQEVPTHLVDADIKIALEKAQLSMLFQGDSVDDFSVWQREFRSQINYLLGESFPPEEWTVEEEQTWDLEDHTRIALLLKGEGAPSVPVYLLIPKTLGENGKAPAVVCVHGHGAFGNDPIVGRTDIDGVAENIAKHNYDYGLQFVRRGYVVAAPCMIPFGRRVDRDKYGKNDPCAVAFVRMQAVGQLPMAANLRDLRWCIDLLQSRPEVDPDRIGCAGLSYGGRMTMLLAAMDERVKVSAVSGALNLMQERMSNRHSCGSQMIPGLLIYGDYPEIGSLIAPRPCVWETGSEDKLIVPVWDEIFRDRLRLAYRTAEAEENLHFDRFEGGHQWSGKVAFPLFDAVLKE